MKEKDKKNENDRLSYRLIRSARKTAEIQIKPDGEVVVRVPLGYSQRDVDRLLLAKREWLLKHLAALQERRTMQEESGDRGGARPLPQTNDEFRELVHQAGTAFVEKAAYYAKLMQVDYKNITVRDQKTRWGSCSSKGNLNFNWRLIMAPEPVLDYVVVHELAHRLEMNHSPRFWQQVAAVMPDYQVHRNWLRRYGACLSRE